MSATWTLAITGKGGVGKSTLAALAVRWLGERRPGPVLAVDADPNTSLDILLGVQRTSAVGTVREEVKQIVQDQSASVSGMGKQRLLEMNPAESGRDGRFRPHRHGASRRARLLLLRQQRPERRARSVG